MTDGPNEKHAAWIKGRVRDLMFHFYVPDVGEDTKRAIMRDWVAILSPFSRDEIDRACVSYAGRETRVAPHPGAIRALIIKARAASASRAPADPSPSYDPPETRMSPERIDAMFREIGFRPKTFGNSSDA